MLLPGAYHRTAGSTSHLTSTPKTVSVYHLTTYLDLLAIIVLGDCDGKQFFSQSPKQRFFFLKNALSLPLPLSTSQTKFASLSCSLPGKARKERCTLLPSPHTCSHRAQLLLNMDITGHFESASCVIEVAGSATLAQVKGKLVAELGVPRARHVGVRVKGGDDIGNDDLRICDTVIDEGCAVELYCTGANIAAGVIQVEKTHTLTLSPCDGYLAVWCLQRMVVIIFDTETHERLCSISCCAESTPCFSPCSRWISCASDDTWCVVVYRVETGALEHSFGDGGGERMTAAWSPCGTKLLSWCKNKGLQVWDIATGIVVHEWVHIVKCDHIMRVAGDRVVMLAGDGNPRTIWDYTTGVQVMALTCPAPLIIERAALSPNQRLFAACANDRVRIWNIETGECVFEDASGNNWTDVAVSNDVVAVCSSEMLVVWCISTGEQLLRREFENNHYFGIAISSCGGVVMSGRSLPGTVGIVDISYLS